MNRSKQKKYFRWQVAGALALFLIINVASPQIFAATSIKDMASDNSEDNLKDQLDEINAKIKAYKQIVDLKERQGSSLAEQIKALEAQAASLEGQIAANEKTLKTLETEIISLQTRIGEKEILVNHQKKVLSELMRSTYSDYASNSALFFLASNDSLSYLDKEEWRYQTSDKVREILESVQDLRQKLVAEQTEIQAKKSMADSLRLQLVSRNEYLETTKENKASLLAKTQAEADKYDDLVDDLQKQREAIEDEIEDLESSKIGELNLKDMPAFKKGVLSYPVKNIRVTQAYGKTSFSRNYASGKHNGIDYGGSTSADILAAASGKVIGTGNLGRYAYGRWVAIDHGNGIVTMYGHMSSIKVSRGDRVERGDKLGKMGTTGFSTGVHLHFTVFSAKSFEVVPSKSVRGLHIPIGATVNPNVYLP